MLAIQDDGHRVADQRARPLLTILRGSRAVRLAMDAGVSIVSPKYREAKSSLRLSPVNSPDPLTKSTHLPELPL